MTLVISPFSSRQGISEVRKYIGDINTSPSHAPPQQWVANLEMIAYTQFIYLTFPYFLIPMKSTAAPGAV